MPFKASLTSAWPRLVAHGIVVVALGAAWAAPRTPQPMLAIHHHRTPAAAAAAEPLTAMASRARVAAVMPVAGAATGASASALTVARAHLTRSTRTSPAAPPQQPAPAPAAAATSPSRAGWGNDISWPQCDGAYPSGAHDIGVVGVTGGRPFTTNPCLASQFAWARSSRMPGGAQVYVNLEIDGTSAGPHHCGTDDHPCRAYDYGWASTQDAIARARGAGVTPGFWWLDVEVGNNWSDEHPEWNQATVQGAIDAARAQSVDVGIYSSVDQWEQIVPGNYRPGVPTWLAVVGDSVMAPGLCGGRHSLTGGPVYMVQYDDNEFDKDHVCAAGAAGFAGAAAKHPH